MKKKVKKILIVLIYVLAVVSIVIAAVNAYVKHSGNKKIISPQKATELKDVDCIIVLGCGVWSDGRPSAMLSDRLKSGIELYNLGVAPKILMSGDHGREIYDEVNTMKRIAVESGVPSSDVFMDHAGFSTYESMYRAKEIFGAESVVIVSQDYHLYRALYIAEKLGIEAVGVGADYRTYGGQAYRDAREILARFKDFFKVIFKPEPTHMGEVVPVTGDGNITNDRQSDFE